jgi:hypothetical protein
MRMVPRHSSRLKFGLGIQILILSTIRGTYRWRLLAAARRECDPENQGTSYDIQYLGSGPNRGSGRIYDPFSDSQLNAALHKEFVYPRSAPPWVAAEYYGKTAASICRGATQYLDQTNGTQASSSNGGAPARRFVPPANRNSSSNDIGTG